jgi:hypothetical protein
MVAGRQMGWRNNRRGGAGLFKAWNLFVIGVVDAGNKAVPLLQASRERVCAGGKIADIAAGGGARCASGNVYMYRPRFVTIPSDSATVSNSVRQGH